MKALDDIREEFKEKAMKNIREYNSDFPDEILLYILTIADMSYEIYDLRQQLQKLKDQK